MLDGFHVALQVPISDATELEEGLHALELMRPPLRHLELHASANGAELLALIGFDDNRSYTVQRSCIAALAGLLETSFTDVARLEGAEREAYALRIAGLPLKATLHRCVTETFAQLRRHVMPHILRVAFESDDDLLSAWARAVAEGALWVPGALEGERFSLTFTAGTADYPDNPATHVHRAPPGHAAGLWLEVKPGHALNERLAREMRERKELHRRVPQAAPEPREADLRVTFDALPELTTAWATELSRGALFVDAATPPALRTRPRLLLTLPNGAVLTLQAEVVHRVMTGPRVGVGLQLLEVTPATFAPLRALLEAPPRKPRVLVIDDEAIWRSTLVRVLHELDADVVLAKDGHEGLVKIIDHYFELDLVVLDLHMPELDGRTLLDRVRRLGGDAALRIFLFSATSREELAALGEPGLATMVFSKNDPLSVLACQLARELGRDWPKKTLSAAA